MVSILALLALGGVALAQYGNSGGSGSSSSSSSSAAPSPTATALPSGVHAVQVGNGGFNFQPESLTVPVGDTVEFFFHPLLHGVAQANFDDPCHPANDSAFWSGFMSVQSGVGSTSFKLKINSTEPIWYYCPQTTLKHCQSGMVGVINPPSGGNQTIEAFKDAAKNASTSSNPASVQGGIVGTADQVASSSGSAASSSPSGGLGAPNAVASGSLVGVILALFGVFVAV
ncbi:hypothetical protein NA57DRAFT_58605 [Rhizodiscina lignyota]|uniref:Cupredoxin n=1 Tax=Rhizodiscina lignyota TaxID=1504668 RepID=A0A9P4IAY8_9PEZI|nr:hypothetical protein NA57DRAFT_58605 [Rhizodiscina lignyota]